MPIHGVRLTPDFSPADVRPKDWREGILLLFPNGRAPLFALTAGMRKKVATDPEYNWFEKEMLDQRIQLSGDVTTAQTTLTCTPAAAWWNAGVVVGTILRMEQTDELIYVSDGPTSSSDDAITVVRGYSGSAAAQVLGATGASISPFVHAAGTTLEENSSAPTAFGNDVSKVTNYTQIFRNTYGASRTAQNTRLRTGDDVKEMKREALEIHSAQIEKALWFGKPDDTQTINGEIARTTGGIFHFLPAANKITPTTAGQFDLGELEGWLEQAFRFGSSEKMGFCGNVAMLSIQQVIRKSLGGSFQLHTGMKEFGMDVSRLITPFGTLVLKTHPLFNQLLGGTATAGGAYFGVNSWLAIVDMQNLVYRFLRNSDTQHEPKLQNNDVDGLKAGFITECGLEIHHAKTHFLIQDLALPQTEA